MKARTSLVARGLMALGALTLVGALAAALSVAALVRRGFSTHEPPSALEAWLARLARDGASPARVRERKNPLAVTPAVMAEARAHWADHCAGCHANDGSGDTPFGRAMYPRAPDMRQAPTQGLSDGELYAVIQNGVRLTGMPAFGRPGEEDDAQTWALVAFIRHLPRLTPAELAEMKELNPKSVHELQEQQAEDDFLNTP